MEKYIRFYIDVNIRGMRRYLMWREEGEGIIITIADRAYFFSILLHGVCAPTNLFFYRLYIFHHRKIIVSSSFVSRKMSKIFLGKFLLIMRTR